MKCFLIVLVTLAWFACPEGCYALTITSPRPGSVFHPGDKVVVKVEPSTNESLQGVFIFAGKLAYSTVDMVAPYEFEFSIDPEFVGVDTIFASGKLVDGKIIEKEVEFKVALPSSVQLEELVVREKMFFITTLPAGSPGENTYKRRRIRAYGKFSDGVRREMSSHLAGTKYSSSDEEVASVNIDGVVVARKIGKAKITVMNGDKKVDVEVVVDEKH